MDSPVPEPVPVTESGLPTLALQGQRASDILLAAKLLREGGVVVLPTDTLYGLAASVLAPAALARVFEIKQRPVNMPVPVLLATASDLSTVVESVPSPAWDLIDRFWPGPLTLVLPARRSVSPLVTAGTNTVAIRVPAHRTCLEVLETLGEPVVGTSANLHGAPPASTGSEAWTQLMGRVDAVLFDDRDTKIGLPSTIVEVGDAACRVHRIGAVSVEAIRHIVGPRMRVLS